jgi:hypothetical protein
MQRAAPLAPNDFLTHATLFYTLAASGQAAEATPYVEDLLVRFGDQWECHARVGYVLAVLLGQPERGCAVVRRATELQPDLEVAWRAYGATLSAAGRGIDAQVALRRAWDLRARPRWPIQTMEVVEQMRHFGDVAQEREWLERALADAGEWHAVSPSQSHFYRGQALEALGDSRAAVAYRAALDIGLLQYDQLTEARTALRRLGAPPSPSGPSSS